jgi:PadR family transcriptional regulator PadR
MHEFNGFGVKGVLRIIVLKMISENKIMHGYEITKRVKNLSNSKVNITDGALYPVLHDLEIKGFLISKTELFNNRLRKYYTLSKEGKILLKEKLKELSFFIETINNLILTNSG